MKSVGHRCAYVKLIIAEWLTIQSLKLTIRPTIFFSPKKYIKKSRNSSLLCREPKLDRPAAKIHLLGIDYSQVLERTLRYIDVTRITPLNQEVVLHNQAYC
jgi:hypothetical protein